MTNGPERYVQLCEARGDRAMVVNGAVFRPYNRMVVPLGPVKRDYSVTRPQARELLEKLGGVLVMWTSGFDLSAEARGSYAVICNELRPLRELKYRSQINRGLNSCEVKRIDAEFLSENGYEVFVRALDRYGKHHLHVPDEREFRRDILVAGKFEDIVHLWGVFYKGELIAYSTNHLFGKTEAKYTTLKFRPDYLQHRPSHALFYRMTEYYLQQQGFEYVNAGFRTLLHATKVQAFLQEKLGFRRVRLLLDVVYPRPVSFLVKATYPFKGVIGRLDGRLAALYELEKIRRGG